MLGCVRRAGTTSAPAGHTPRHTGQTSTQNGQTSTQTGQTSKYTGQSSSHYGQSSSHSGQKSSYSGHTSTQTGQTSKYTGQSFSHYDQSSSHSGQKSSYSGHTSTKTEQIINCTSQTSSHTGKTSGHTGRISSETGKTSRPTGPSSSHSGQKSSYTGHTSTQTEQNTNCAGQTSSQTELKKKYTGQKSREVSKPSCGQKSAQFNGQFWRTGRFLIVFLLAMMSVRSGAGTGGGAGGGGARLGLGAVCGRGRGLTERQRALCRAAPAAAAAVAAGLRMAYAECEVQMRGRRWNCSGVSDGRHFGHVISMGTKEAAFTYALTSAGVTHALSAACARGDLPACGCRHRGRGTSSWQWGEGGEGAGGARCGGGGGAEVAAGARFARRWLDARELEHDARALMNLHNNRLGRKVVGALAARVCRCHGVSGSCGVRTCWRALPPFPRVAAALAGKLRHAVQVSASSSGSALGRAGLQLVHTRGVARAARRSQLVFLEASPAYCEPEPRAAALGTHRRRCNHTSTGEDGCSWLCCGRGWSAVRVAERAQCRCSFRWCCAVRCDTCLRTATHHVCN